MENNFTISKQRVLKYFPFEILIFQYFFMK